MTGHTADDQAETVLLNLLRGASLPGLGAVRPGPTRPLLALRRAETVALCAAMDLTVVNDPSNHDPRHLRNRVRHELLPALADLVAGVAKIAADRDLTISVIAHAGDGNTHPLIVHDPNDAENTRRANIAFGEIMDLAVSLGGTITGEHGVGRLKRPWLAGQLGPEVMELNRRIKAALDPDNILNPGAGI